MLNRSNEYEKMARVERDHWWYRSLHRLVRIALEDAFPARDISVLDAGCGTGGLMLYLRDHNYQKLCGFDLSTDAVKICKENALDICQKDLRNIGDFNDKKFDVIISNDTLYFLSKEEICDVMNNSYSLLNQDGILIFNVPALKVFSGIHDLSVGIKKRFSSNEIQEFYDPLKFSLVKNVYWPFLLSPIIFLARSWQRLKFNFNPQTEICSDIEMPAPWLNRLLEKICELENRFLKFKPFGSSFFFVLRKL